MSQKIETLSSLEEYYHINSSIIDNLRETHKKNGVEEEFLTELQKAVFSDEDFWDDSKNVIVQGRTSSGKTLVAQIAAAYFGGKESNISERPRNSVIYLVPLRAMVSEKRAEFRQLFYDTLGWRVFASSSDYQDHDNDILSAKFEVAVVVYEKFFALLAQYNMSSFIKSCGLIVVDELQMMNDEDRGPKLEISLTKVMDINPHCKILGLTTTQCNVAQILSWLDAKPIINYSRPKALEEYVVWPDHTNDCFRYYMQTELEDGTKLGAKNHEGDGARLELKDQRINVHESENNIERRMVPPLISHVLQENPSAKILVFINFRNETKNLATEICDHLKVSQSRQEEVLNEEDEHIQNLLLSDDEYAINMLTDMVPYGVAFHHGGLSRALRDFVEEQFRKNNGLINIVVATETLAIGVNMPADVVILVGIKLPRSNSVTNEMRSHEYKNYIGRGGRLGAGSAKIGKSFLLSPSKAKADDYWSRFVTAETVLISSALKRLSIRQKTPYFFNLIGNSNEISEVGYFDKDNFNSSIAKTMTYHGKSNNSEFPGEKCIELLLEYKLIEPSDERPNKYERTRIGVELASYALSLDTVETILFTGQAIIKALFEKYDKNNVDSPKDAILKFIGSHYLDILYRLASTYEVKNVFVQNRDEAIFTQSVLKYIKSKKHDLIDNWPLKKIVDDLEKGNPLPNQNKSFAIKRAACIFEWMKGEMISSIKSATGLTYVSLGDIDRLGDVVSYLWEAMVQVLSALSFGEWNFSETKSALIRLSGCIKYGLDEDLVILASRHVPYVTRHQLVELKREASLKNMSPEQYVLDPQNCSTQKALTTEQFKKLAMELNERYRSANADDILNLASDLKFHNRINSDIYSIFDIIYNKNAIHITDVVTLFEKVDSQISAQLKEDYIALSYDSRHIHIYLMNAEGTVGKDTFLTFCKKMGSTVSEQSCVPKVFLCRSGFNRQEIDGVKNENQVFLPLAAFAKLYLLSLKRRSSLAPFFESLGFGYTFIPDGGAELYYYMSNFLTEESEISSVQSTLPEQKGGQQHTTLYIAMDQVKCNKLMNIILDKLSDKFPRGTFNKKFMRWGDTGTSFGHAIMKENATVIVFVDDQFKNQRIIPGLVNLLMPKLNSPDKGKVLMLYLNKNAEEAFLAEHALFKDCASRCLTETDCDVIAQEAYELLSQNK